MNGLATPSTNTERSRSVRSSSCFDREPTRSFETAESRVSFFAVGQERYFVTEPIDGRASGNIIWTHGVTDHSARQIEIGLDLVRLGYRTVFFELKGHGGHNLNPDDAWNMAWNYIDNPNRPDDVASLIRRQRVNSGAVWLRFGKNQFTTLKQTKFDDHVGQLRLLARQLNDSPWQGLPLHLVGHSMGGVICLEAIRRREIPPGSGVRSLTLLAPAFQPMGRPDRPVERSFTNALWRTSSTNPALALIGPAAKRVLNSNFRLDVAWGNRLVSDLSAEGKLVDDDPLNLRTLPSGYAGSLLAQVLETIRGDLSYLPPTLVQLPEKDGIVNSDGTLTFAEKARRQAGRERLTLVRFPYLEAHNLFRSSVRNQASSALAEQLANWN